MNRIIQVRNLSKRYCIGARERVYKTFREAIIDGGTAPFRNFSRFRKLTEKLWRVGSMDVSFCPELEMASCGETVAQARKNLVEVILISQEEAGKIGRPPDLSLDAGLDEIHGVFMSRKELVGFTPIELAV